MPNEFLHTDVSDKILSFSMWTCVDLLTWYAGDAEDVGVAHKEALQDVSRLVGINDDSFSGGLGAGTDPNQRRQLFLLPQLLLLLLQ